MENRIVEVKGYLNLLQDLTSQNNLFVKVPRLTELSTIGRPRRNLSENYEHLRRKNGSVAENAEFRREFNLKL